MPNQPLEWLDHAAALVGLWVAAVALNTLWEAAAPKSFARDTQALLTINILLLGALARVVYDKTHSFSLAAIAVDMIWRWWAGILAWACENLEE
ncbi:hypothetical protein [Longimicrobium terrae]|uniref:Uncharacterized protein n=1 Tax=Longimicrobium terrae TaxID=1639882 RepID=A0A841GNG4_9BACT|nr:hypothetical protein [Longimicrobium terrae]MBB4635965.1 hypothetical protein [Longimicrobium terrae]MBB6070361.1 hypothetical protein [Longimicrobium terrae]NNC30858.1 hypothetical protein [Longimicrobium terrae]